MITASLIAASHVLALGIGLGAVYTRGLAIRRFMVTPRDSEELNRLLMADNFWGLAAILWLSTGLARAFGGLEKGTQWYLQNGMFHLKLGLFGLVFLLEIWPMITFIRWRIQRARGDLSFDVGVLPKFRVINDIEVGLVIVIPFVASLMARGFGS